MDRKKDQHHWLTIMAEKKFIVIAGATKCGTTSLFKYLVDHPLISQPYTKETRFFLDDNYPLKKECLGKSKQDYINLFEKNGKYFCEATPDYMYSESTPKKIKNELGDEALIVIVLRDPMDRVLSWFRYSKQIGEVDESCSLQEFFDIQKTTYLQRGAKQSHLAVEQSNYKNYLKSWLEFFQLNEDLLIYSFEDLSNEPKKVVLDIFNRMGKNSDFYDSYKFTQKNKTKVSRYKWLSIVFFYVSRRLQILVIKFPSIRPALRYLRKVFERLIFREPSANKPSKEEMALLKRVGESFDESYRRYFRNLS